jgi:hypothetical protein
MRYELSYGPSIQGRGELVRLVPMQDLDAVRATAIAA